MRKKINRYVCIIRLEMLTSFIANRDVFVAFLRCVAKNCVVESLEALYRVCKEYRSMFQQQEYLQMMWRELICLPIPPSPSNLSPSRFILEYNHRFRRECSSRQDDLYHLEHAIRERDFSIIGEIIQVYEPCGQADEYHLLFDLGRRGDEEVFSIIQQRFNKTWYWWCGRIAAGVDVNTDVFVGFEQLSTALFEAIRADNGRMIEKLKEIIGYSSIIRYITLIAAISTNNVEAVKVMDREFSAGSLVPMSFIMCDKQIERSSSMEIKLMLYALHFGADDVFEYLESMRFQSVQCFSPWSSKGYDWLCKNVNFAICTKMVLFRGAFDSDNVFLAQELVRDLNINRSTLMLEMETAASTDSYRIVAWMLERYGDQLGVQNNIERWERMWKEKSSTSLRIIFKYLGRPITHQQRLAKSF